ncbi:MAG TPA: hypothetical protein VFE47_29700 [Tepidisphaeraceae bacterium]|nr:hypothetical protein [Tepidisphaeraceae bacterium]
MRNAIAEAMTRKGWELCGDDDEFVDRTLLISPHGKGWLTIVDETFDQEPDAAEEFVEATKTSLARPTLIALIEDIFITELVLVDHDHADTLDLASVADGWKIPAEPPWSSLFVNKKHRPSRAKVFKDLDALVCALGLSLNCWLELAGEYDDDETKSGSFIRLRSKGKHRRSDPATAKTGKTADVPPTKGTLPIPTFLFGDRRSVSRRWKKIMAILLKTGSWDEAMRGQEFVPIEEAPFAIFRDSDPSDSTTENIVRLHVVPEALCGAATVERRPKVRELMLEGMDQFWMSMTMLGGGPFFLPRDPRPSERTAEARAILKKFVRWWDELCSLQGRYHAGWQPEQWPHWVRRLWPLIAEAGMPDEMSDKMYDGSAAEAGVMLKSWLEQVETDETPQSGDTA